MTRLSLSTMSQLPENISCPAYKPADHGTGIVHMGIGGFHRAHQAWYTHKALEKAGGDWRITAVSLRSGGVRDELADQDCLYSLTVSANGDTDTHILGSVANVLVAPENPSAVIAALADASTHVVTVTVTEKGYYLNNATGELDMDQADIQHDLMSPDAPKTLIGFLVSAMVKRQTTHGSPLTVISCENLTGNGRKLEAAVRKFAAEANPDLLSWVDANVTFPCTMVDRIVPAPSAATRAAAAEALGLDDQAAILTEPFHQWVIEENFAGPVPPWDQVGATFTKDVEAFEDMKLRLLNASHSALAYLGFLAGYKYIADAVADPALLAVVRHLMQKEMIPTLDVPEGFDLPAYCDQTIARFANPDLPYGTTQVAGDGSQKVPQRILPALKQQLESGGETRALTLTIAAWMRYAACTDEQGNSHQPNDPMLPVFEQLKDLGGNDRVDAFVALRDVFSDDLRENTNLRGQLYDWMTKLENKGARETALGNFGTK